MNKDFAPRSVYGDNVETAAERHETVARREAFAMGQSTGQGVNLESCGAVNVNHHAAVDTMDGDRLVHLDGCVGMMVWIDGDYDARIASAVSGFSHNERRIGYGGTDQFGCLPDGIDSQGFDGADL